MAPQSHSLQQNAEDDDKKQSNIERTLSNIELNNAFTNKGFVDDQDDQKTSNQTNTRETSKGGVEESRREFTDTRERDFERREIDTRESQKEIDFDDLLPHVGEFGLYQKILFLLMIPFAFFVAFVYFSQIFMSEVPQQHWCWVPELANLTVDERRLLAIPPKHSGEFSHDRCSQYDANWTDVLASGRTTPDDEWGVIPCRRGWEYNYTDIPYETIASQLDWVCERDNYAATAQSIFFCGAILGGLLFGWIADKHGRVAALVGTNVMAFSAGIGTAFCNSFWTFALCRFLVGLAFDNCFTMMYILVLEYVGPKWRTFVANMSIALFFTCAACLLPWIALAIGDWRTFALVTSAPFILAVATPWLVPESARWLVSQGKIERALTIMKKFERINKTRIPDKVLAEFTESSLKIQKDIESSNKTYSVLDLFRTPRLRSTTLLLIVIWMVVSLVFDGHVRNVGSLGLDLYLTFTIASFTELPADTFLTLVLDRWGRRWLACGSMVLSGVFSLLATTVPIGVPSATLAIMGRFAVNISYNIGLQYAAELLPTVVRAQGVALIHIMGYVASILAPFVVYLANISQDLPLLILGGLGIAGGVLCLFLPETMDADMPQTLKDGEEFGKDQLFWEMPCINRKSPEPVDPVDHPGRYMKRSTSNASSRTAGGDLLSCPPGVLLLNRTSIRASLRASERSLRRRNVERKEDLV